MSRATSGDIKRDMNLALDHSLPEASKAALEARIAKSPQDAVLWDRMQMVDGLLGGAPVAEAPFNFADKVMASIAAGKAPTPVKQHRGLSTVFGLLLAIVIVVPLLLTAGVTVRQWLSDPTALSTLLQQIILLLNGISQLAAGLFQMLAQYAQDNRVIPALLSVTIPITLVWGWVMWMTSLRRQQIVYRIPVRVA
jgi:hypothetical protein